MGGQKTVQSQNEPLGTERVEQWSVGVSEVGCGSSEFSENLDRVFWSPASRTLRRESTADLLGPG